MIRIVPIAGAIAAALVIAFAGVIQRAALVLCFLLYLSIVTAGQTFFAFQWDLLLLETGFLAIFLNATRIRIALFWWLLFRLMFSSGIIKLISGDATWRSLTALRYHYETQPLPNPIAWYMHQLPAWFQAASVIFMFVAELAAPFFIFAGRRFRPWAAAFLVALQVLILATGNFAFFNLLAIALCIPLFDDASAIVRRLPAWTRAQALKSFRVRWPGFERIATLALVAPIVFLSLLQMAETLSVSAGGPARKLLSWVAPWGIVNGYGLFANMTTSRPEIVIEASEDAVNWKPYEFRYKPGDLRRSPPWIAPYQPRLDWQMWFAALGNYRENPFFVNLMERLLEASPPVLGLLQSAPFGTARPHYIRAMIHDYHFTDFATRRSTGQWWTRTLLGLYFPTVSLK